MNFDNWKNRKPVREILEGVKIADELKDEVSLVLANRKVTNDRMKNLAYWVKYDVKDNYLERFDKLLEHPRNDSSSQEIYVLRYGEEEGLRRFNEKSTSCSQTIENMIARHGETEGLVKWEEYRTRIGFANSEDGYIAKHGEQEGREKYKKQCNRNSGNLTLERKIELLGEQAGKEKFEEMSVRQKEKHSLENYTRLYGEEEGTRKWNEICEMHSYKNSLVYYIEKYGEEGTRRIKVVKDTSSLEVLIRKHGEEKGYELFAEYNRKKVNSKENFIDRHGEEDGLDKWGKSKNGSLISYELFESLHCDGAKFGRDEITIHLTKQEHAILGKSLIRPDFIIDNKIIEFYGDYWHGNDKVFDDDFIIFGSSAKRTASEQRKHDKLRENILLNRGFKLKIVWESDYKNNKDKTIEICKAFLSN